MLRKRKSGRERAVRRVGLAVLLMAGVPALAGAAQIELVSRAPFRRAPDTAGGVDDSLGRSSLSADGRYFVYTSSASNLAPGQADVNGNNDVFLYDRLLGTTALVSHTAGSASTTGDDRSDVPVISADGSYVAFASLARDLVPGLEDNPAGRKNVFLYERASGKITLVSHQAGKSGKAANGFSDSPLLSADGSYVGYGSVAPDLVPGQIPPLGPNVFLYERASGTTALVSRRGSSAQQPANGPSSLSALSADGRYLAFFSYATDHVSGQNDANRTMDVFLYDRLAGAATLVSHATGSALTTGNGPSGSPSLSADGRYLVFSSGATDLVSGVTDDNRRPDVFLYDRLVGTVSLVSRSAGSPNAVGPQGGFEPIISQDGSTIAYFDDDPDFVLNRFQILVFDRLAGSTAAVSQSPPVSAEFPPPRDVVALSGNGRYVVFTSFAEALVSGQDDGGGFHDVFLHDRATGATVLVSHANGLPKKAGNGDSFAAAVSADGSWIAFVSGASDLEAGKRDSSTTPDVFLHETATAVNRTVSLHPPGMASLTPRGDSRAPSVSGDGRYVAFVSFATGLFPGHVDLNSASDVFLYDRISKTTVLVSRSSASPFASANAGSEAPTISRDGNYVLFASRATNLVAGQKDSVGTFDIFLYDRRTGTNTLVSRSLDSPVQTASGTSSAGGLSADGSIVAFTSLATDLVRETDSNEIYDVFWFDRRTGRVTLASRTRPSPAGRAGNNSSFFSSMSPDGAFIAFSSAASDLVPGVQDTNGEGDAFVYERRSGKVALLSRTGGTSGPAAGGELPVVSADGRYAAYISRTRSVFLLDRVSGKAVQAGPAPVSPGTSPGLSDDGRYVLFSSDRADVIPGQDDRNEQSDLFLFDRVSGQTSLVSHVPGSPLRAGERGAFQGRLSADGRFAVFFSLAPDLQPGAPRIVPNVFLYDQTSRNVTLVSRSVLSLSPQGGNGGSLEPVISAQGGFVAFASFASDLVTRDFNGSNPDVFLYVPNVE